MPRKQSMSRFICPKCDIGMTVRGHDKSAWNYDHTREEYVQRYYVSCPCTEKLLDINHTLKAGKENAVNAVVDVTVKLIDPPHVTAANAANAANNNAANELE